MISQQQLEKRNIEPLSGNTVNNMFNQTLSMKWSETVVSNCS